jgi:hypothetical protein
MSRISSRLNGAVACLALFAGTLLAGTRCHRQAGVRISVSQRHCRGPAIRHHHGAAADAESASPQRYGGGQDGVEGGGIEQLNAESRVSLHDLYKID